MQEACVAPVVPAGPPRPRQQLLQRNADSSYYHSQKHNTAETDK
jgi:hypothetical protein